jgi:thiamine-monophosphate kinase
VKEFAIIENFFQSKSFQRKDVLLGIGDDCAITQVPDGQSLVVTTDTLVEGVHFLAGTSASAIAHKAIAVNLSDLASMGAEPAWMSLSLCIPEFNQQWLTDFSDTLHELSQYYSIQLIGGDTVQGPLTITITAQGFVPIGQALTRSGAKPGDLVYVTGTLGDAGVGLEILQGKREVSRTCRDFLVNRLHFPSPRLLAGTGLRRLANACIDLSDGISSDLQHILDASKCGVQLQVDKLPISIALQEAVGLEEAYRYALSAGDDYELLFTVSEDQRSNIDIALANYNVSATCIGQLNGKAGSMMLKLGDQPYDIPEHGFEHFSQ